MCVCVGFFLNRTCWNCKIKTAYSWKQKLIPCFSYSICQKYVMYDKNVCLIGFFVPLDNFSLSWRPNFYICSALVAIEQWGYFPCYTCCDTGYRFIMVIPEDPRHSHVERLIDLEIRLPYYYYIIQTSMVFDNGVAT